MYNHVQMPHPHPSRARRRGEKRRRTQDQICGSDRPFVASRPLFNPTLVHRPSTTAHPSPHARLADPSRSGFGPASKARTRQGSTERGASIRHPAVLVHDAWFRPSFGRGSDPAPTSTNRPRRPVRRRCRRTPRRDVRSGLQRKFSWNGPKWPRTEPNRADERLRAE